jgi:hypothetical protein
MKDGNTLPEYPFGGGSAAVTPTVVGSEPSLVAKNSHYDRHWKVSENSSPTTTRTVALSPFTPASAPIPDTDNPFLYESALHSGDSQEFAYKSSTVTRTASWTSSGPRPSNDIPLDVVAEEYPQEHDLSSSHALAEPVSVRNITNEPRERVKSTDTLSIPWLKNPEMMAEDEARLANVLGRNAPPSRFKTVGKAPRKYTPTPINTGHTRGSIAIEPIMIPRQVTPNMEIVQGSLTSNSSSRGVLRDSEVLGIEDGNYVAQPRSFFYHN